MQSAGESAKPLLLIVDDDPAVREALEAELAPRFGDLCRVEALADAGEAMDAMAEWQASGRRIALAIVDQKMPGLTGIELIQKMSADARSTSPDQREMHPATSARTVLLTGYGGPGIADQAQREPAVHRYREKPWRGDVLAHDVQYLLADFWRHARATRDPLVERVEASDLQRLWDNLESFELAEQQVIGQGAKSPGPADDDRLLLLLRDALRDREGNWPSVDAIEAFMLGVASPAQLEEVRAAVLASTSFRKHLAHLVGQVGRLSRFETQLEFDELRTPESFLRWLEEGGDTNTR